MITVPDWEMKIFWEFVVDGDRRGDFRVEFSFICKCAVSDLLIRYELLESYREKNLANSDLRTTLFEVKIIVK